MIEHRATASGTPTVTSATCRLRQKDSSLSNLERPCLKITERTEEMGVVAHVYNPNVGRLSQEFQASFGYKEFKATLNYKARHDLKRHR